MGSIANYILRNLGSNHLGIACTCAACSRGFYGAALAEGGSEMDGRPRRRPAETAQTTYT